MRLTVIGSGTISLSPTRGCASYLLEAGDLRILLDCGPGSAHTMARHGIDWWGITHVVLSHWHLDHIGDLPTLVFAWRHARLEPRTAPLVIVGPAGTAALLGRWAEALGGWLAEPGFPLQVLEPGLEEPIDLGSGVTLTSRSVPHTAESVAYSVGHDGRRLVYTGDTGHDPSLGAWAAGCDLLLAECSLPDAMPVPIHLTPSETAVLATAAAPGMLVVTHMYPPLDGIDLRAELGARWTGPTVIATDGLVLDC
ncbi:MAG: ribonuclease Z [Gemmatimonadaceae bacterium]|nr:ribonuclease Z [Gemmatimonadaceae bacterium]